jgi:catechol 2,3-dioxygenase-like lactoylglutathione lyase family enzyme
MSDQKFEMRLEVVPVPVADIDRAKAFYVEKIGFNADFDNLLGENGRIVQLTPHGSGCSVLLSKGIGEISDMVAGSVKGLHLVVKDVAQVRDALISRGVDVSDIVVYPREIKFAYFKDPDGNSWALQEIPPGI